MKNWIVATLGLLTIFIYGASLAAGDAAAGKEKSASCAACHGADGNSVNPEWPNLASQHPEYLKTVKTSAK